MLTYHDSSWVFNGPHSNEELKSMAVEEVVEAVRTMPTFTAIAKELPDLISEMLKKNNVPRYSQNHPLLRRP